MEEDTPLLTTPEDNSTTAVDAPAALDDELWTAADNAPALASLAKDDSGFSSSLPHAESSNIAQERAMTLKKLLLDEGLFISTEILKLAWLAELLITSDVLA